MRYALSALLFLSFALFAQELPQDLALPTAVSQSLQKHQIVQDEVSIWIQRSDQNIPLVNLNGEVARNPASLMKLVTTAASLWSLGENYEWTTDFYLDALPDQNGVVQGNLYIKGGGNPFLVEEELETLIRMLRGRGLRHFTGNLVLDSQLFYLAPEEKTSLDKNIQAPYNAFPHPLMVNFSTIKLRFERGEQGLEAHLIPKMESWKIEPQWQEVKGACNAKNYQPILKLERNDNGYASLYVRGKVATQCDQQESIVALGEGSEQFYYWFRDLWYQNEGSFDGYGVVGSVPPQAALFMRGGSKPLREQIKLMNQNSNNVMARQLFLSMGAELLGKPGSLEQSRRALAGILQKLKLNPDAFYVDNGAGLSREARLVPSQLAALLKLMHQSSHRQAFADSLAIPGEQGTMKNRFSDNPSLQKRIRGKTGSLDQVRGFAGYVQGRSGVDYIVVIIGNGNSAVRSRDVQDDLLRWLAEQ